MKGHSFDEFVQATLRDYGVPGAVVTVSNAAGPTFLKGYGVRRQGATGAVDENTRFQIASMSKFITATAVGVLVDRGVVSWDVPVHTFSPNTVLAEPYATENATLRDYFAHRTGLPAYAGDLLTQLGYGPDELVRRARFLSFDHSFRAKWAYSNYGIFLGQQSSAHTAGMSACELLSSGIFRPLGMTRSGPMQAELFKDDNRAAAHNLDGSLMPDNIEKAADTIPHFMWWESVAGLINIQTGYSLTVFSSLAIAEHLMSNDAPPGCWTPAGLMGESFVLSLPGTSKLDLSRPSA